MLSIFDLDGTLAELKDRIAIAGNEPPRGDKKVFQQWLDKVQNDDLLAADLPISEVLTTALCLKRSGHQIVFLTGRSEKYRKVSEYWLKKYGLFGKIFMRDNNDWRPAGEYKAAQLKLILKQYQPDTCICFDDDISDDTTQEYSKLGIQHLKVMPRKGKLIPNGKTV